MQRSPKGTAPCQPRPSAWVTETIRVRSPNGAAPNSPDLKHRIADDAQRLGPPRWGYILVLATVPQADGLGWHRSATMWRKAENCQRPAARGSRRKSSAATLEGGGPRPPSIPSPGERNQ